MNRKSTGLQDINGKDIYLGDVLVWERSPLVTDDYKVIIKPYGDKIVFELNILLDNESSKMLKRVNDFKANSEVGMK